MSACFGLTFFTGTARAQQTGTVAFSQSLYTVATDQSNAAITVSFTGSTNATATVKFDTSDGTATNGVNYVGVSTNLAFAPGALTTNVTISILNNSAPQSTQTVNLALSNPTGPALLGSPSNAVLQIINSQVQAVQFVQSAFTADDTNTQAFVTLIRTGGTNGTVAVYFSTSDGSAKAGVNYTMTTGTVTFANGVVTNTVTIPLVAPLPGALTTNQTVNLTLSNPTGGASLGSPSQAVLTIRATGPPVIQLTATDYVVHEHAGRATVGAIRFGDTSIQANVDYATSDGTARNGVDYFGTSGTLIFGSNVSSQSFSFQIQKFSTFQSNKTVNVMLANPGPVGATLGPQSNAVVTIVNDRPQTAVFTDSAGNVITLMLRSIGTMQVLQQEPLDLVLSETEATTKITMKVKHSKTVTARPQIGQITGGDCGVIDARNFDVVGAGIELAGYLKQLRIHDLTNGAVIVSNGATNQSTSIVAHNLEDGCAIIVSNRIGRLQAARLGNGSAIIAPQIGPVSLKGDKKIGLPGDCEGVILISGVGLTPDQMVLGSLKAAGTISNTSIIVSNGSAGTVTGSRMVDSIIYLGYTPNDPSNSISGGGTFIDGMRLRGVKIRSTSNGFANSDIAAAQIGSVHLGSVVTDNAGIPFGVTGRQVSGASSKNPLFRFVPNGASDQSLGDFHVLVQ